MLVEHVVDANLGFSSRLLRCHRQVISLIHSILVLALLLVVDIILMIGILDHLVHLDLVPNTWWTL